MTRIILGKPSTAALLSDAQREQMYRLMDAEVEGFTEDNKAAWRKLWRRIAGLDEGELLHVDFTFPRSGPFHRRPGICMGYSEHGCEPAHPNAQEFGKGMGHKAADIHAAACHACHAEIDSGRTLSKAERREAWLHGCARTMLLYLERGWIGLITK